MHRINQTGKIKVAFSVPKSTELIKVVQLIKILHENVVKHIQILHEKVLQSTQILHETLTQHIQIVPEKRSKTYSKPN